MTKISKKSTKTIDKSVTNDTYRIGILINKLAADGIKVTEKSIRYYQEQGILPSPKKVNEKEFAFTDKHYYIMKIIKLLQEYSDMTPIKIRDYIKNIFNIYEQFELTNYQYFMDPVDNTNPDDDYYNIFAGQDYRCYQRAYLNLYQKYVINNKIVKNPNMDNCDIDQNSAHYCFLKQAGIVDINQMTDNSNGTLDQYLIESVSCLDDMNCYNNYEKVKLLENIDEITTKLINIVSKPYSWPIYHIFNAMMLSKSAKMQRTQHDGTSTTFFWGDFELPPLVKYDDVLDHDQLFMLDFSQYVLDWKKMNKYWINLYNELDKNNQINVDDDIEAIIDKLSTLKR